MATSTIPFPSFFAKLPHMADDSMDPYQYRAYGHLHRVCASTRGTCTQGIRAKSDACQMSKAKYAETEDWLIANGWVKVIGHTPKKARIIVIVDRWAENEQRYRPASKAKQAAPKQQKLPSPTPLPSPSATNRPPSGHPPTEAPSKPAQAPADFSTDRPPRGQKYLESENPILIDQERTTTTSIARKQKPEKGGQTRRAPVVVVSDIQEKLDPRLKRLYDDFGFDVPDREIIRWVEDYGLEAVVQKSRWYMHGRSTKQIRSRGWLFHALADDYGYPYSGYDPRPYLTSEEIESLRQEEELLEPEPELSDAEQAALEQEQILDEMYEEMKQQDIGRAWTTAHEQLQLQMEQRVFDTYLRGARALFYIAQSNTLVLCIPDISIRHVLEHRLKKVIVQILAQITGRNINVVFMLNQEFYEAFFAGELLDLLDRPTG